MRNVQPERWAARRGEPNPAAGMETAAGSRLALSEVPAMIPGKEKKRA